MKKIMVSVLILASLLGFSTSSYASDWDKAGKVLAVIEGARILTGGNVDIIGNITGINRGNEYRDNRGAHRDKYVRRNSCRPKPVWVPHYVWVEKYVPEHEEYSQGHGTVIVAGHYIRYMVEDGGHWE